MYVWWMLIHERSLGLNQQHHLLDEQEKNKKQKDVIKKTKQNKKHQSDHLPHA